MGVRVQVIYLAFAVSLASSFGVNLHNLFYGLR